MSLQSLLSSTRRRLLFVATWAGAAGALTGCEVPSVEKPEPPPPDPDLPRVRAAAGLTRGLVDRYVATVERHPALRDKLTPYTKRHRRHLAALTDGSAGPKPTPRSADRASATNAPPEADSPTASASPAPVGRVPDSPPAAVRGLISLENQAAGGRRQALRAVRDPELARLLASVGSCETAHAITLAELADELDD